MAEKDAAVLLREIMKQEPHVVKDYVKIIIKEDFPILCVNRSAKKNRTMPFKALYENNNNFWQQEGSWEFFMAGEDLAKLREKAIVKPVIRVVNTVAVQEEKPEPEKTEPAKGFGSDLEEISAMSNADRIKKIEGDHSKLKKLLDTKHPDREVVTEALVETTKDAALINHAVLLDAMRHGDGEAKKLTQHLVNSTREMVKTSTNLISEDIFNDDLMNTIVEKSNGTIVQHMTRVYLNGISFLAFYNKLVSTSSIINKLRISFAGRYREYYRSLLPHVPTEDLTLEHIFYRGMRAIPTDFFQNWATGFLIHDIGKASAVEYHEGESAYNREIVTEHVKIGYLSVMNKTNYPREAGLITGYHHEYYGHESGYGYFRTYLDQYKKMNSNVKQDYCIAYELEPMLDYQSLSYFPAKMLEIIDIYDSVTDPNRKYHRAMSLDEALIMMRNEFILKHKKIDPVLFDIFTNFVRKKLEAKG